MSPPGLLIGYESDDDDALEAPPRRRRRQGISRRERMIDTFDRAGRLSRRNPPELVSTASRPVVAPQRAVTGTASDGRRHAGSPITRQAQPDLNDQYKGHYLDGDQYQGDDFDGGLYDGGGHLRSQHPTTDGQNADFFSQWFRLLDPFIRAYDDADDLSCLKRAEGELQCQCDCPPSATRVTVYDKLGRFTILSRICEYHMVAAFFQSNLFPASTQTIRTAIAIPLLRTFQALKKHSSIGAYGLAAALADEWLDQDPSLTLSSYFRRQLMTTSIWYQSVRVYGLQYALHGQKNWLRHRPELDRDDLLLTARDLADSCPACFQQFITEAPQRLHHLERHAPQVVVSVDGNFSQKRKERDNVAQKQPLPPRRFLSHQQVRLVEAQLKSQNLNNSTKKHDCSAKVKAADPLAAKGAAGVYDVTGVMGLCCRHDHPLIFCDITTAGERHHYAVALVLSLLKALDSSLKHIGVMYDIGCRFANNQRIKRILPGDIKVTWTIPLFHVYGHTSGCQARYSPRRVAGMGWSDGEGMERVWSGMANLIASTRSMSQVNRRFQLEEQLAHLCLTRLVGLQKRMKKKGRDMKSVEAGCWARLDEDEADYNVLEERLNAAQPPPFRQMPGSLGISNVRFNQLIYMSEERQRQATIKAGFERGRVSGRERRGANAAHTHLSDGGSDTRERPASDSDEDDSDEEDAVDDVETSELADVLFRSLSHYLNLRQQMEERKKDPGSTGIIARLREAMKVEKPKVTAAHEAVEAHLRERYPGHKSIDEADLLTDETRHWASVVATNGSLEIPWWSEYGIVRTLEAFDNLLRLREEQDRVGLERRMMRDWVVSSLNSTRSRQESTGATRSGRLIIGQLEALHFGWFNELAPSTDPNSNPLHHPPHRREAGRGLPLEHMEIGRAAAAPLAEVLNEDSPDEGTDTEVTERDAATMFGEDDAIENERVLDYITFLES